MKLKLFGAEASRITTEEMRLIHQQLQPIFKNDFSQFTLTKTLATKLDHGDIDILVLGEPGINLKEIVHARLGKNAKQYHKNGNVHSVLYQSSDKTVHVDFILSTSPEAYLTLEQYYSFNDLSSIVGVIAKKLNFKYGTKGFFKRFQDKRGNWHDILISTDLLNGLNILGYRRIAFIKSPDDIVVFVLSSPLFGVELLDLEDQHRSRSTMNYVLEELHKSGISQEITDEDYYFKQLYPEIYQRVENTKKEINQELSAISKYNGNWLIENFDLQQGPDIGRILKSLDQQFGLELNDKPEDVVKQFIKEIKWK